MNSDKSRKLLIFFAALPFLLALINIAKDQFTSEPNQYWLLAFVFGVLYFVPYLLVATLFYSIGSLYEIKGKSKPARVFLTLSNITCLSILLPLLGGVL